ATEEPTALAPVAPLASRAPRAAPLAASDPCPPIAREEAGRFSRLDTHYLPDGCLQLRVHGPVAYTPARDDVRAVGPGGVVAVVQAAGGVTRRMEVRAAGGRLARRYTVDGAERPAPEGEAWFRDALRRYAPREAAADACPAAEDARFEFVWRAASTTTCLELRRTGAVGFTPDFHDVRVVSEGGVLVVLETRDGVTRRMEVAPEGGRVARRYTVDGVERPAPEGEAWFRDALRVALRRAGLDGAAGAATPPPDAATAMPAPAAASATRIVLAADEALRAVRRTAGDGEKRRLLLAILRNDSLPAEMLQHAAAAARGIASDDDKAAVLEAVARRDARSAAVASAVIGAARGIAGDGDRRRVLEHTVVPGLPAAVVADLLGAVSGMAGDGDKAAVLVRLAPRAGETPGVRRAFFGTLRGFASDGHRRRVLLAALPAADDSTLAAALAATAPMVGESDRLEVLKAAAARRRFESAAVREGYFRAAAPMVSETARAAAPLAALRAQPAHAATQDAVVAASTRFASDARRADVLLEVVRTTDALRDAGRRARFLDALRGMASSADYRRVLEAVVP
ncbi:hypothetical protein, partial [Roseisolibacter sp. H3M3-2]|uniref:hypothetical protein n=1 Tax=Roseisolibacter sp. H3M3-2 TaxID=3031323 RepID=UPI0023DBFD4A